jgi:aerobic carbon-monoxide dehydrogenase medium subunit
MIPRAFELHTPTTIVEAISLLKAKSDAKVLAGGQSLVPLMKLRLFSPPDVVDIGRIPGLRYIRKDKGRLLIGAMTVYNEVASSPLVKRSCAPLAEAAGLVADQQVRNRGTLGGGACHADPAGDTPAALLALDAEFAATDLKGERVISAKDFFKDIFTTSLRRDELLTEIRVPVLPAGSGGTYVKFVKAKSDYAIIGVAAAVALRSGRFTDARIGLCGVGPTPIRAIEAERALRGRTPTDRLLAKAGEEASTVTSPFTDLRGDAEYKREMVKVMVKRALRESLERARP